MTFDLAARPALALALLAGSLFAQYDATAPEPLAPLGGTLFIGGGGALPDEVYRRFVELAGGDRERLVVLAAGDTAAPPAALGDVASIGCAPGAGDDEVAAAARELEVAAGVWIAGYGASELWATFAGTPVEKALQGVIARGGVLGCNGDVATALTRTRIAGGAEQPALGVGLDLVPGAVIDVAFGESHREDRLLGVLQRYPRLVGLGISRGTALVLHRRFLDVLGTGSVYACIAGNDRRPVRIEEVNRRISPRSQRRSQRPVEEGAGRASRAGRASQRDNRPWRPRRLEDLIALSRAATARTRAAFPAAEPPVPRVAHGTLMIVGGGGMPPGFLQKFIELAGGPDALLLFVPCTESAVASTAGTLQRWRRAGATNVDFIHTKDRHEADTSAVIHDKLRRAGGLFFGGGRQWNLVDSWQHTEAHRLMHEVLARGGVIAGSSAGASIQGSYMPRGNPLGNLDPMAEGYETGLGFLTGVAIDQHFTQRGRLPDMAALMDTYPQLLGIGLDEAASILVQGSIATCYSREGRHVYFYDRHKTAAPGEPDWVRLANGQKYDLAKREIVESR